MVFYFFGIEFKMILFTLKEIKLTKMVSKHKRVLFICANKLIKLSTLLHFNNIIHYYIIVKLDKYKYGF